MFLGEHHLDMGVHRFTRRYATLSRVEQPDGKWRIEFLVQGFPVEFVNQDMTAADSALEFLNAAKDLFAGGVL